MQKIRPFAIILAAGILSGCVSGSAPSSSPPEQFSAHKLTSAEEAAVRDGVRSKLKDPESARFGRFASTRSESNVRYVCGLVNAKNSFGGYTGDGIFMGMMADRADKTPAFLLVTLGTTGSELTVAKQMCLTKSINADLL